MRKRIGTALIAMLLAGPLAWAAGPPAQKEAVKILTTTQLRQGRPANGFRLAYSANDAVCHTALDALNEPGYDKRYFNTSNRFTNSLPELLIQTRLNVPRMLIGTHLYRTEEYALITENGRKKYWYRFIGQGEVVLGTANPEYERPWFGSHTSGYSDFMDFIDDNLVWDRLNRIGHYALADRVEKKIAALERNAQDIIRPYKVAISGQYNIPEIISVANAYYVIAIDNVISDGERLYIVIAKFMQPDNGNIIDEKEALCLIESTYLVKIAEAKS